MLYRCKIVIQIDCASLEGPKITTGKDLGGSIQDGKKYWNKKIAFVPVWPASNSESPASTRRAPRTRPNPDPRPDRDRRRPRNCSQPSKWARVAPCGGATDLLATEILQTQPLQASLRSTKYFATISEMEHFSFDFLSIFQHFAWFELTLYIWI